MQFFWNKKILVLLVMLLAACRAPLTQSNNDSEIDTVKKNPYLRFQQETASLEPVIETSSILTQSRIKKQTTNHTEINLPEVRPLDLEGNIDIAGTTGTFSLNQLIYDRFVRQGYAGLINFSTIGTDKSIKLFCQEKKFSLLTLARPMTESEVATCQANGIEPIDFPMGKDAVVIVVNRQNNFVKKVTLPMLAEILTREKWSDINPRWPNQPIDRLPVGPGPSFDLVVEKVLGGDESSLLNAPNTELYWYEQPMIQQLNTNIYGISFLSNSLFAKASKSLKSIAIDGTTPQSIKVDHKAYPLERYLYIYADRNQLKQNPNLTSFINFYLTNVNQEIEESGLFYLSSEELNQSKIKWLQVMDIE